jgi:hypothetical protein
MAPGRQGSRVVCRWPGQSESSVGVETGESPANPCSYFGLSASLRVIVPPSLSCTVLFMG